jgi:Cleft lip and palate transmembrane protein 1 (CLPTM1)
MMPQSTMKTIVQGIAIFVLTQWAVNTFFGKKDAAPGSTPGVIGIPNFSERTYDTGHANYSAIPQAVIPIWPSNSTVDMNVYVSGSLVLPALSKLPKDTLVINEKDFTIGNFKDNREIQTTVKLPSEVQHNGTLWAHIFVGLAGAQLDPLAKDYDYERAVHFSRPLTHYLPKKRARKLKNLLDKSNETETEAQDEQPKVTISNYYHPNFTLSAIPETGVQRMDALHPSLLKNIVLDPTNSRDPSGRNTFYYPVFFLNTFWQLKSHMTELNDTVKEVPLNIQLNNLASWKYTLISSMDEGMKTQQQQAASGSNPMASGSDGSEFEKLKEILLDTNSYLLATTFFVSILHMIFEGLAFKSDISHWRKKKDNVGTSVRTILANVFMQGVIFLYLLDNSDGTSWMILAGQGFGIFVEAWKITKTVDVRLREPGPDSRFKFLPYIVVFEDKHTLSETEKKTQEYDAIAFNYMYMAAVPLLLAYAVYSLYYETHKGWYSFVIETLVGSVYAYGFLMMVPSLYINYRLQSVAHMPSKTMTYKFLNTFIDDLFAFTIRMPTLHRLATLRDDVIFFIWLYQKWVYKVDYTRVNEFGQGGDDDEDKPAEGENVLKAIDQDKKEVSPASAVASASGAEKIAGAKKRKH